MNTDIVALTGILLALLVGVVSPGPSFVMVARLAVASSRREALGAALGMGVGGLIFAAAALMGLQGLFAAVPMLYVALKVLGGLYLCYLGWTIFRSAHAPLPSPQAAVAPARSARSFWLGLTTQIGNPKTAVVYASVFAAFLPPGWSPGFAGALLALVFAVEAGWYALVAGVLSSAAPQRVYLASKRWIDQVAGIVMIGLGLRLVLGATKP